MDVSGSKQSILFLRKKKITNAKIIKGRVEMKILMKCKEPRTEIMLKRTKLEDLYYLISSLDTNQ